MAFFHGLANVCEAYAPEEFLAFSSILFFSFSFRGFEGEVRAALKIPPSLGRADQQSLAARERTYVHTFLLSNRPCRILLARRRGFLVLLYANKRQLAFLLGTSTVLAILVIDVESPYWIDDIHAPRQSPFSPFRSLRSVTGKKRVHGSVAFVSERTCIYVESPPVGTKFAIHAGALGSPPAAPFERFSVCVLGRGRGIGEAGEPLQTADGGTTLAGFKYLRGAAPLLDSYGLTWKTTGPDDLVPTPRPMPKVVLVRPL